MTENNLDFFIDQQKAEFHEKGFLIVRNVLSPGEVDELRLVVQDQAKCNGYPPSLKYPEPGKYTISGNKMAESGLSSIAEHPTVVDAVECLLEQRAYLTAFVAYLRTPGSGGAVAHCDYKRWRPVGSSMNWLFAIIPLTDFDKVYGPFLVSPGSHKLTHVIDKKSHIRDLSPPDVDQLSPFIDPELKAGDLLLANGYTWHKAPPGTSSEDRCGIFNKYCAIDAPPAAGYYPYNREALDSLSDTGKRLIPISFDKPISTTRLLIENSSGEDSRFLAHHDKANGCWELPGGVGWEEEGVKWDIGARIASLQALTETQLGVDIPWMSYIEDVEMESGICRVYGFKDELQVLASQDNGSYEWYRKEEIKNFPSQNDYVYQAIQKWKQGNLIRGKGKAVRQSKNQFD